MFSWKKITGEEFSTLFDVYDYQYWSREGDTDFDKVDISDNESFIGAIKEIEKVNHYYLLIKR